ncbi:helix-turn-helix domain-containing protein [Mycobacteroides abscessus]|uniref:helix-turn-helix domain-containing protein n=1 Tax=Mycobacteroides abscessus TaxID=36809 RepID=UPI001F285542|nr:helix-turn-helix domain-containing protein [Mycobacteroides abscessus]MDM2048408.1 helix-turn-helix domain-containing protein [Mycobacteroides abscessus]MDM2054925.1 helix-turn-helix domain-containing protein [Mycobacteroides abscessus]MDM2059754.1 helix-turn-helix domain-containing protein [Mycobacteroides abscessus]MDM2061436.1 helix-turn-helix domain-containing protein [Mycobacteroides abscessus]MDM2068767.1 helix-turn-helix domain-containing protein [Mycobacteroides abscessus]
MLGTDYDLMDRKAGHYGQEGVMSPTSQKNQLGEVYMYVRDPKKIVRLMICQEVSQREVSTAAGWKSHSYLGRILRGEVRTLETDPALRIAHFLKVPVDDLFATKVDNKTVRSEQEKSRGARRVRRVA